MTFIRLSEEKFFLNVGRSCYSSDKRIEESVAETLAWDVLEILDPSHPSNSEERVSNYHRNKKFAKEIMKFSKNDPKYIFWEIFDFNGGVFSYSAKKELFFEEKKKGATLADAIDAMKKT